MIFLIRSKMVRQEVDLIRQTGNLNLWRTRIIVALTKLTAKPLLHVPCNWHLPYFLFAAVAAVRATGFLVAVFVTKTTSRALKRRIGRPKTTGSHMKSGMKRRIVSSPRPRSIEIFGSSASRMRFLSELRAETSLSHNHDSTRTARCSMFHRNKYRMPPPPFTIRASSRSVICQLPCQVGQNRHPVRPPCGSKLNQFSLKTFLPPTGTLIVNQKLPPQ